VLDTVPTGYGYPAAMSDQPLDQREREELCRLLLDLGPDAATLDEGWTTADLAAHLLVRERDPRSMPGILAPHGRFGATTTRLMERRKADGYEQVVARVRSGPPLVPWRIPRLRTLLNLNEYYVHHEDVRRANGRTRRTDRPDLDDALWALQRRGAKLMTRSVRHVGLTLRRPSGDENVVRAGSPMAVLCGEPSELALYLTGRRGAAQVDLSGPDEAVAAITAARFGI
jgi:uncharacterized protein (TIGR03085 family)